MLKLFYKHSATLLTSYMATQHAFSLGLTNETIGLLFAYLTDEELVAFFERDVLPKPLPDVVKHNYYGHGPSLETDCYTIWSEKYKCELPVWVKQFQGKY